MSRRRGLAHIGMSFIDTLTCGIGAMLMLWMAQVSRPEPLPKFGGTDIRFEIELEKLEGCRPDLAIRFQREDGQVLAPAELSPDFGLIIEPCEDGAPSYTIDFTQGVSFTEKDRLLVYLHDLHGRPFDSEVSLKAVLFGSPVTNNMGHRDCNPDKKLSGLRPLMSISLDKIADSSNWQFPEEEKNP